MDPIADMLIKIKNASIASHEVVLTPASNMKRSLLECLKRAGYVAGFTEKTLKNHPVFEIELLYKDGKPRITDVVRVSKPSRRMYMQVKEMKPVKNGHGILIVSTSKGILSNSEARKELVGGEAICKIW